MSEFFTNFCYNFLSCWEMFIRFLGVFFIGTPKLALMNMIHARYQIIGWVLFVTWLVYFFISKYRPTFTFLTRGRVLGTILFWIGTAIFYKNWFPLSARTLPPCGTCGPDYPPLTSLTPTIINILIFQILWHSLAYLFKFNKKNRTLTVLTIVALFITLQWFAGLALLFD